VHGLFRPSEAELVREQYERLTYQFRVLGIVEQAGRQYLIQMIAEDVVDHFGIEAGHAQSDLIHSRVKRLFDYEGLFVLPEIDWAQDRTIAELWEIREELTRQKEFAEKLCPSSDNLRHMAV